MDNIIIFLHKQAYLLITIIFVAFYLPITPLMPNNGFDPSWYMAQEILFFEEPNKSKAILMLKDNQMHVYAYGLSDPVIRQNIDESKDLTYKLSYGNTWALTLNPAGPTFNNGMLNPFSIPKIREAINWLIDRNYIAQEIYSGLARPKFLPLSNTFPDFAQLADIARTLEIKYAPDPEKARLIITTEMQKHGAEFSTGKWLYKNQPVKIIFLIRTEDNRRQIGDYVATLLEEIGFTVDRQYKTADQSRPIWLGSQPAEGQWNIYTGGWITTRINRDESSIFNEHYTPKGGSDPLHQNYHPTPRFAEIADRLARNDYAILVERKNLMTEALELVNHEANHIWLVDAINFSPLLKNVDTVADLAGGINGSALWPYTLRFIDNSQQQPMRIGMPGMLTEPWNPVAGSTWIYDQMITRGTGADSLLPNPFTGLLHPFLVQKATVTTIENAPVSKTLDWLELNFVPQITVPQDAWINWNTAEQRLVSVQEAYPQGLMARAKTTVFFEDKLFNRRWHDGSITNMADLLLGIILGFERATKNSAIYDAASVPDFETFTKYFRGFKIIQENPLVFEYYSDRTYPDAELIAQEAAAFLTPATPWHTLALGVQAEMNGKLAFSQTKADEMKIERTSYIAGHSLVILDNFLKQDATEGYIPFAKFMSKYVTPEIAKQRYTALQQWYGNKHHFWVSNGPYYIETINTLEKSILCRRVTDFIEPNLSWLTDKPRIAQVDVIGLKKIKAGAEAVFTIKVSFAGQPYPAQDVQLVKFLIFNAKRELILSETAKLSKNGEYLAKIPAEISSKLSGATTLEAIVVSKVVSIATFSNLKFVTIN
jgi:peptide/nickel transport system substrate-binding protein